MITNKTHRQSEKGNVLFLILIAVALFAALSYVVTQSTRSGGGSTEREKNILSSAQMTQYPTALRTSLIRLVLGGMAIENIYFNAPQDQTGISANQLVFHPSGGGATFQDAPADLSVTGNLPLGWTYNASNYVPGVGIDTAGGNDVIAFLPGVSQGVCKQVNEELGIDTANATPACTGSDLAAPNVAGVQVDAYQDDNYAFPAGPGAPVTAAGCTQIFARQASGCFIDTDATPDRYVFYSVLLER